MNVVEPHLPVFSMKTFKVPALFVFVPPRRPG